MGGIATAGAEGLLPRAEIPGGAGARFVGIDNSPAMLERAGFVIVDTYFRWLNFGCLPAVRQP